MVYVLKNDTQILNNTNSSEAIFLVLIILLESFFVTQSSNYCQKYVSEKVSQSQIWAFLSMHSAFLKTVCTDTDRNYARIIHKVLTVMNF